MAGNILVDFLSQAFGPRQSKITSVRAPQPASARGRKSAGARLAEVTPSITVRRRPTATRDPMTVGDK